MKLIASKDKDSASAKKLALIKLVASSAVVRSDDLYDDMTGAIEMDQMLRSK